MMAPHEPAQPLPFPSAKQLVVVDSAQPVYQWLSRWPQWPTRVVILTGPEGIGLTTWGRWWCGHSGASPQTLSDELPSRPSRWLWLDDADTVTNPIALHGLINATAESGGGLLLTAHQESHHWPTTSMRDLTSRLRAATAIHLPPLTDSDLIHALRQTAQCHHLNLSDNILDYLRPRLPYTWKAVRAAIRLFAATNPQRQAITHATAKHVVQTLALGSQDR